MHEHIKSHTDSLVAEHQHFIYQSFTWELTAKLHTRKAAAAYNSNARSCVGGLSQYVYV